MSAAGVLEQDLVSAYIYSHLMAVSSGTWSALGLGNPARIAEGPVPAAYADAGSFIVYQPQTPEVPDVAAANPLYRIMSDSLWLVKAVVRGTSYVPARKVAQVIDTTLHGTTGTVALDDFSGSIMAFIRVGAVRYVELDSTGEAWRHSGLLYRVQTQ